MQNKEQQDGKPFFQKENKIILKGWQNVNPKNQKTVDIQNLQTFMKFVFQKSKDLLDMDFENTDFQQLISSYLQQIGQVEKKYFCLEEAIEIINWIVDLEQEEQESPQNQPHYNSLQEPDQQIQNQLQEQDPNQTQKVTEKSVQKLEQILPQKQQQTKILMSAQIQKLKSSQKINEYQQQFDSKILINKQQAEKIQDQNKKQPVQQKKTQKKLQNIQNNINFQLQCNIQRQNLTFKNKSFIDWGKIDTPLQNSQNKLYKRINSYSNYKDYQNLSSNIKNQNQNIQESSFLRQSFLPHTFQKQPQSIKKSLAKLNQTKIIVPVKTNNIPVLKLPPTAKQKNYLKNQKIMLKNKKLKPLFHPEQNGFKELFKFYSGLDFQMHMIKKFKDPLKDTFDHLENRINNLHFHKFMLICKDFNLIEGKMDINKQKNLSSLTENTKSSVKQVQILENKVKKNRIFKVLKPNGSVKQVWNREQLGNYFKKHADYTLNIKYDKFVEIIKHILKEKLQLNQKQINSHFTQKQLQQKKRNSEEKNKILQKLKNQNRQQKLDGPKSSTSNDSNQKPEAKSEKNGNLEQNLPVGSLLKSFSSQIVQLEPKMMALFKYFKVDSEEKFFQTIKILKIQYKIIDSQPEFSSVKIKKKNQGLNGKFEENIVQQLKERQIQKQRQKLQTKQKYLSKYERNNTNIYSSFKSATNQSNTLNSLYGSNPKLILRKDKKTHCKLQAQNLSQIFNNESGLKNSRDYIYSLNLKNIIRSAKTQIKENKENNYPYQARSHFLTESRGPLKFTKSNLDPSLNLLGYKKLNDLQLIKQQHVFEEKLTKKSQLEGANNPKSHKTKIKNKDFDSILLQRLGCNEDDELLDKYFDQQQQFDKAFW